MPAIETIKKLTEEADPKSFREKRVPAHYNRAIACARMTITS
jgi:hypothetical protein